MFSEVIQVSHKGFSFRLRKVDADLEEAIRGIDASAMSDLCRDGLRLALGLKTTKRVEVKERPLLPGDGIMLKGNGQVWTPKK